MTYRPGAFTQSLTDFARQSGEECARRVRKIALQTLRVVMIASPVDNGSFRASWNLSVRRPDFSVQKISAHKRGKKKGGKKKGGINPAAFKRGANAANTSKFGDTIYVTNALPYAHRIENGWSEQAPQGVVAPAIRQIQNFIAAGRFK